MVVVLAVCALVRMIQEHVTAAGTSLQDNSSKCTSTHLSRDFRLALFMFSFAFSFSLSLFLFPALSRFVFDLRRPSRARTTQNRRTRRALKTQGSLTEVSGSTGCCFGFNGFLFWFCKGPLFGASTFRAVRVQGTFGSTACGVLGLGFGSCLRFRTFGFWDFGG